MLVDRILNRTAVIGVVGLGYVGLPLAVSFAEAGFCVSGIDNQQEKIDILRRGKSYIADVDESRVATIISQGKFQTVVPDQGTKIDIAVVCVPTPITDNKKPDLSYVISAVEQVKNKMAGPESLMVLESSTYPGTTRSIVLPILNSTIRYVAYSPERVDPGSKRFDVKNTPKLVGGIDKESTELATLLYAHVVDKVVPVSSVEVAETTKLYENVFRNVNIALANEMALICERIGVSIWEVIDAAATKPFGFMPFYPGVGVGGSCIPKDPHYLLDKAMEYGCYPALIETAITINERQPNQIEHWVAGILADKDIDIKGAKVMVLGTAFKRDVSDTRDSPSIELINRLCDRGMDITYNDPYVSEIIINGKPVVSASLVAIRHADCVVIATNHSCYNWKQIVEEAQLVFDTRNATKGIVSSKIYRLGERRD